MQEEGRGAMMLEEEKKTEKARAVGRGRERGGDRTGPVLHSDNTGSFQPVHRSKVRLPPNCAFWAEAQTWGCLIDLPSKRPICAAVPELISLHQPTTAPTAEKPH